MRISLINRSKLLEGKDVIAAVRAVNRQLAEDFAPHWHMQASLRFEYASPKASSTPTASELRGDAIIYLADERTGSGYDGSHEAGWGIPFGVVYTAVSRQLQEDWTVTLSHEVLELVGDTDMNHVVEGPHPGAQRYKVFHWHEICDAVQAETYVIDGVNVCNFVLPRYYQSSAPRERPCDFLSCGASSPRVAPFGVRPGGYVAFYDPHEKRDRYHYADDAAKRRHALRKKHAGNDSRSARRASARTSKRK